MPHPSPTMAPALWSMYRTMRELGSSEARAACDLEVAAFGEWTDPQHRRTPGAALRRLRCSLRHRRDASLAVGLASVMPHSASDSLDRSLLAMLRASLNHHRNHCAPPPAGP